MASIASYGSAKFISSVLLETEPYDAAQAGVALNSSASAS